MAPKRTIIADRPFPRCLSMDDLEIEMDCVGFRCVLRLREARERRLGEADHED